MRVADVRGLFDSIIEEFPLALSRLSAPAAIVQNPAFESALAKIQLGRAAASTLEESQVVKQFKLTNSSNTDDDSGLNL